MKIEDYSPQVHLVRGEGELFPVKIFIIGTVEDPTIKQPLELILDKDISIRSLFDGSEHKITKFIKLLNTERIYPVIYKEEQDITINMTHLKNLHLFKVFLLSASDNDLKALIHQNTFMKGTVSKDTPMIEVMNNNRIRNKRTFHRLLFVLTGLMKIYNTTINSPNTTMLLKGFAGFVTNIRDYSIPILMRAEQITFFYSNNTGAITTKAGLIRKETNNAKTLSDFYTNAVLRIISR